METKAPGHRPSRTRSALVASAAAVVLTFALPALAAAATQTLTVQKAGAGAGSVVSFPAGINCGATCSAAFAEGASVTLTPISGANTGPAQWTGCASVNGEGKCLVTMSAAKEVTVTFELIPLQLSVTKAGAGSGKVTSSPVGIDCGSSCQASFGKGSTVTLTAVSAAGTQAAHWTGCSSVDGEDRCLVTMSAAKSVSATFDPKLGLTVSKSGAGAATSTVTSSPAGIACGATCSAGFEQGDAVTLTAVPGSHTEAAQWTGCTSIDGEDRCLVTMSAAKAVSASFSLEPGFALYPLTVERIGNGTGTVSGPAGSIDCGAICSGEFVTGSKVTLTATAAEGSAFSHWSGACTGTGSCLVTLSKARAVTAKFVLAGQRTLSIALAGSGSVRSNAAGISCTASCAAAIVAGKKITLTAKAAVGSAFGGWSGACTTTARTCTVTMSEARGLTATFTAIPTVSSLPAPSYKPLRCKRGFKKKKVRGKTRCVKAKRHHGHKQNHRRAVG